MFPSITTGATPASVGWLPPCPDQAPDLPAPGRVAHDLLGGHGTFEADRQLARRLVQAVPDAAGITWVARQFLHRAVRHLLWVGIDQVIDLGCGIIGDGSSLYDLLTPTAFTVRAVYVDIDPIAVGHAADVIARTGARGRAAAIEADIAQPAAVLDHPDTARLLDLGRPVALIATDVLQHLTDPAAALAGYSDATVAGSHLVLSHPCADERPTDMKHLASVLSDAGIGTTMRSRTGINRLFTASGFGLLPPGLIWAEQWRPTDHHIDGRGRHTVLAGIGLKPPTRHPQPAPVAAASAGRP